MQVLQGKTQKVTVLHARKSITRSSVESLTIYSLKLADGVSTFITNRVNNKHVILLQTHSRELWAVTFVHTRTPSINVFVCYYVNTTNYLVFPPFIFCSFLVTLSLPDAILNLGKPCSVMASTLATLVR